MQQFTIPTNPNQSFLLSTENFSFRIDFRLFNGITYCSISAGEKSITNGSRLIANCFILSKSLAEEYGNFVFYNPVDGEYPDISNFNGNNVLTYFSPEEMKEIFYNDNRIYQRDTEYLGNFIGSFERSF